MELFEEAVLAYIAGPPQRFVRPQFSLAYQGGKGTSYPDFVVLDYKQHVAYVVEVSAAYNIAVLVGRVGERKKRWYDALRVHLNDLEGSFSSWGIRTTLFVRADRREAVLEALQGAEDVTVIALDDVMRSWKWNWEGQTPLNPLDHDPKGEPSKPAK